ncbi:MAG: repeat-containing protein [Herbinix sp.]|jgi:hypothetical protein|nr:repeat-containing protein [Herbinix sp.]
MKVFISSTFIDMQEERDVINKQIYSIVTRSAKKKGELVTFYDLRWGIPSSEEDIVLKTCFDQIDACSPYFVAFLGDRYGWIPDYTLVKNVLNDKNISFEAKQGISMTQLEIEYAISNADETTKSKMLFCFRNPISTQDSVYLENYVENDSKNREKIEALKNKIRASFSKEQIFDYDAGWDELQHKIIIPDSVQKYIAGKIIGFFGDVKAKEDNWYNRELQEDKFMLSCKGINFWGRRNEIKDCIEFIENDHRNICFVKGAAGCGKSSFVSKMALECRDRNMDTVYFFCGNKDYAYSGFNVLKNLIYRLELLCGIEEHYDALKTENNVKIDINNELREWKKYFTDLLEEYVKQKRRLAIIIDGIDQLGDDIIAKKMEWLPYNIPSGVSFIFSHTTDYSCDYMFEDKHEIELPLLQDEEVEQVVPFILKQYGKKIGDTVIEKIRLKRDAKNFLYLSLIVQKLLMFDSDDFRRMNIDKNAHIKSNRYFCEIVEKLPDSLADICTNILDDVGDNYNEKLTTEVMNLIATSRGGLRENDFREIFRLNLLEWRLVDYIFLVNSLPLYVIEREDGFVDFMHRCIREGYQKKLNQASDSTLLYHMKLFQYIKTLNENDKLYQDEMMYHAFFSKEGEYIYKFLCKLDRSIENKLIENGIKQLKYILVYQYNQIKQENLTEEEHIKDAWLLDIAERMCREGHYGLWVYKLAAAFDKKNELLCINQIMDICKKVLQEKIKEADNERLNALAEILCIQARIDIEFNRNKEGITKYDESVKIREKIFKSILGDIEPRKLELSKRYIYTILELAKYYQKVSENDMAIKNYNEVIGLWDKVERKCRGEEWIRVGDTIIESFYERAYCNYYIGIITKKLRSDNFALKYFKLADSLIWHMAPLRRNHRITDKEMQLRNLNMLEYVNVAYNGRNKEELTREMQYAFEWFEKAYKLKKNSKRVLDEYLFAYGKTAEFYAKFDAEKAMVRYEECLVLSEEREKLYGFSDDILETVMFLLERGKLAMQKAENTDNAKGYFKRAMKKVKYGNINNKYYDMLGELVSCMKELKMEGTEAAEEILLTSGQEQGRKENKQGSSTIDFLIVNSIGAEQKIQKVIKDFGLEQDEDENTEDTLERYGNIRPLDELIGEIEESKNKVDNALKGTLVGITKLNKYFNKANEDSKESENEAAAAKETEETRTEAYTDGKNGSGTDAFSRIMLQASALGHTTQAAQISQSADQKTQREADGEQDKMKSLQLRLRSLNEGLKKKSGTEEAVTDEETDAGVGSESSGKNGDGTEAEAGAGSENRHEEQPNKPESASESSNADHAKEDVMAAMRTKFSSINSILKK